MKRCPKCNRVYPTNTQRFCTHDGGLLVVDETRASGDLEATKMISRDLVPEAARFDPFKATVALPPEDERTSELRNQNAELPTLVAPPPAQQPQSPPAVSQAIGETTSPSMRPAPSPPPPVQRQPPPSTLVSDRIGETTSPSMRPAPSPPVQPQPSSPPPDSDRIGETTRPSMRIEEPSPTLVSLPPPASPPVTQGSGGLPSQGSGGLPPQGSGGLPSYGSGPIAAPPAPSSGQLPSPQFSVAAQPQPVQPLAAPQTKKKSKLPLILGILAILFLLGLGVLGVGYFFVVKPMLEARRAVTPSESPQPNPLEAPSNVNTAPVPQETTPAENVPPPFTPPANAAPFVNSNAKLDGKLAEHYVDFSFYYPNNWQKDPKSGVAGASNFAKVERRLPPDFTQENFAVGWYSSSGSLEADQSLFHSLAENMSLQFEKNFPEYRKVSEGATRVGVYDGYEFRFEGLSRNTAKGDLKLWGRVVFLPPADGGKNGVTLLMLATSLAPELEGVSDVGEKGQMPMILESFRFGRPASL